jgi:hypothetical protein
MEEAPQEAPSKYTEAEEYQRHGCPVPHAPTVVNPCPQCRSAAQGVPPHEVDDQPHACGCCAGTCELCNPELQLSSLSTPQPVAPTSDHIPADNRRVTSLSEGATTEWVDNPLNCMLPIGEHLWPPRGTRCTLVGERNSVHTHHLGCEFQAIVIARPGKGWMRQLTDREQRYGVPLCDACARVMGESVELNLVQKE